MDHELYKLKLENLQLKLQQSPTTPNILEYLEQRIQLLEQFVFDSTKSTPTPKP